MMRLIDATKYDECIIAHMNVIENCQARSTIEKNQELRLWRDARYDLYRMPTINPYEWISVEDRFPEDIGYFLVWNNKKCQIEIKFFYRLPPSIPLDTYVEVREYFGNVSDYKDITHWTYLPMSPMAKDN